MLQIKILIAEHILTVNIDGVTEDEEITVTVDPETPPSVDSISIIGDIGAKAVVSNTSGDGAFHPGTVTFTAESIGENGNIKVVLFGGKFIGDGGLM